MENVYLPSIEEVKGNREWSALKQDLLDECKLGRASYLPGKEDRPKDTTDPNRRVRASFIRYLLSGGCDGEGGARPHPKVVLLRGAWIDGLLDLGDCVTKFDLSLKQCLFLEEIDLDDAELGGLYLTGSRLDRGLI